MWYNGKARLSRMKKGDERMEVWEQARLSMVADLYADYQRLAEGLDRAVGDLSVKRAQEREAVVALQVARADYEYQESYLVQNETEKGNPEKAINGPNDLVRDNQRKMLLRDSISRGGRLFEPWEAKMVAESEAEEAKMLLQEALDHFSALRNVAKMVAGLAQALGA